MQKSVISVRITSLYGLQPSSVVFGCKTAWLVPELLVSIGPYPHSWFLHWKQRLLGKHYKSLWILHLTCRFVHAKHRDLHQNDKSTCVPALICVFFCVQNNDFRSRLIGLYGSQTSSVVLSTHNSVLSTRVSRLYGFQPSPVVLCMRNSVFREKLQVSVGPWPQLWFLNGKQRPLDQNNKSLSVPGMTCPFVHVQQGA